MKYSLEGISIDVGRRESVVSSCRALIGKGGAIYTLNSLMAERALRDPDFLALINSASVCTVDGVGVKLALASRGIFTETLTGVELGELIVKDGSHSLGIIGAKEGVAERAFRYLKSENPSLRASFILSGYGIADEKYLGIIAEKRPKICMVCLGSPRQEYFVKTARCASPKTLFLALGGSLDVYSADKRRAPKAVRALGLEWLYRMMREPSRLSTIPRILRFSFYFIKNGIKFTKNAESQRLK